MKVWTFTIFVKLIFNHLYCNNNFCSTLGSFRFKNCFLKNLPTNYFWWKMQQNQVENRTVSNIFPISLGRKRMLRWSNFLGQQKCLIGILSIDKVVWWFRAGALSHKSDQITRKLYRKKKDHWNWPREQKLWNQFKNHLTQLVI